MKVSRCCFRFGKKKYVNLSITAPVTQYLFGFWVWKTRVISGLQLKRETMRIMLSMISIQNHFESYSRNNNEAPKFVIGDRKSQWLAEQFVSVRYGKLSFVWSVQNEVSQSRIHSSNLSGKLWKKSQTNEIVRAIRLPKNFSKQIGRLCYWNFPFQKLTDVEFISTSSVISKS